MTSTSSPLRTRASNSSPAARRRRRIPSSLPTAARWPSPATTISMWSTSPEASNSASPSTAPKRSSTAAPPGSTWKRSSAGRCSIALSGGPRTARRSPFCALTMKKCPNSPSSRPTDLMVRSRSSAIPRPAIPIPRCASASPTLPADSPPGSIPIPSATATSPGRCGPRTAAGSSSSG